MTEQGRHDDTTPPGRPLWAAAERARVAEGASLIDWTKRIGISRMSYNRLASQENPPIARTVKKIADTIGLDYDEAMRLAGVAGERGSGDIIVLHDRRRTLIQAKDFQRATVNRQLDILRKAGIEADRTLGDMLVITGLATEAELQTTGRQDQAVAVDDDGQVLTVEFLKNS
ncbi:hypothetical protein [Nonomuraea bangladeshensis]|uniref:hypothetical protein n=1 Tax=Nonomuraea bangladeshensis TaxID=404385 RepID=UPI003C2F7A9B